LGNISLSRSSGFFKSGNKALLESGETNLHVVGRIYRVDIALDAVCRREPLRPSF
jgi:hypothetical protein